MNSNARNKVIHGVKISLNAIFYALIVFLVLFSAASIKLKSTSDIANVFNTGFLSVQSNSMAGDNKDSFNQGDVILVSMLNEKTRNYLQVGDIITFYDERIKSHNTHRIVMIDTINNQVFLHTKGDNTENIDQPIHLSEAISIHRSTVVGAGNVLDYLQTPSGFAIFIILPVLVLFLLEAAFLVRYLLVMNKQKLEKKFRYQVEQVNQSLETEIEKIRKEILRELELSKN
ncbi:MAG: signal peptidase I [Acholeplasmataceae bacterium]|nr:signal peptidase I [Acholeplasmataceae bacterium]